MSTSSLTTPDAATPPLVPDPLFLATCDSDASPRERYFAYCLRQLNEIGLALSSVRDIDRLHEIILSKSRELTGADAGSLYHVDTLGTQEKGDDALKFQAVQNDSVPVRATHKFPVSKGSLAGYVALTGLPLWFEDVYQLPPDSPYKFNPSFDKSNGYRTKSVLVVPLKNHAGEVIGVLQLINRKTRRDVLLHDSETTEREVLPFDDDSLELASSIASQAAVALENYLLLQNIRALFESFVTAASSAIEDRDPSTSGHSKRVTTLTMAMADAADAATEGPFAEVKFTPQQLKELEYAGLLHDFGKIGVRESVLTKSHKLDPLRFQVIKSHLALARQERRTAWEQRKAEAALGRPRDEARVLWAQCEAQRDAELAEIDALSTMLDHANDPAVTVLPDDDFARQQELLTRLAAMTYQDDHGHTHPLLTEEEQQALSIRKGSLTLDEYRQIQTHAALSYEFLNKIKWTAEFAQIPNIAHCHHEKLNGKGYPRAVTASAIPLQSRMMTVADIYDALTAADRPYKKAMPVDLALQILRWEATEGALDADVVNLFISQEIWRLTSVTR